MHAEWKSLEIILLRVLFVLQLEDAQRTDARTDHFMLDSKTTDTPHMNINVPFVCHCSVLFWLLWKVITRKI